MSAKLYNPEAQRHFTINPPAVVSRKLLKEIQPILDGLAAISRNLDLEKFFYDNPQILSYVDVSGRLNQKKLKAISDEIGIDMSTPAGLEQCEVALRQEILASFPGLTRAQGSYRIEIDPTNDDTWALCVQLIRSTAVVQNEIDRKQLENNEDPSADFWATQDVEEVKAYVETFRKYGSK